MDGMKETNTKAQREPRPFERADQAGRTERDLICALAAAIGVERATRLKLFSRYSINNDALDMIVEFDGRFYLFGTGECSDTRDYLSRVCDTVKRILEPH